MKRSELLNVLESVKPGVASKDIVEAMTYFYFSGDSIITYNDKISIQHPLKTDFSLFVKANDLYRIISKLSASDVILSQKGDKFNIKAKTMNANLAVIQDEEIIVRIKNVQQSLKGAEWQKIPDNFCNSISLCAFAASTQESEQSLTCVHVDGNDCLASDNMRIAHAIMDESMDEMFIKASEIKNLNAINPTDYAVTKSWLHFKNADKCIFSIRKVDAKFPDFLPFFDFEGTKVVLPKNIIEGMDITSIFADDVIPLINLNFENDVCIVSVESDSGNIKHRSKIDYAGKAINFSVNPNFLKEMMTHTSSIIITNDKARLETESFSLVTMFMV